MNELIDKISEEIKNVQTDIIELVICKPSIKKEVFKRADNSLKKILNLLKKGTEK